jgi:ABC-type branched-subunit amino acid transport system substrate-binding protein
MTTVSYTTAQKTSLTEQAKRWKDHMVAAIMSDDFDADEDSFRNLFKDTLNFSRLEIMSDSEDFHTDNGNKKVKCLYSLSLG